MFIEPNSELIIIWGCPCTKDYRHTLKFNSRDEQIEYFTSDARCGDTSSTALLKRLRFNRQNYIRVDNQTIKVKVVTETINGNDITYNAEVLLTANYMAFKNSAFGNKWFYAFIDNASYLNNGTVEIQYTVDVLQTWWFDLKFGECYIERETPIADAYEEILVPENIPTGDIINYDVIDFGKNQNKEYATISGKGVFCVPYDSVHTDMPFYGGDLTSGIIVSGETDVGGLDYSLKFTSVINICFNTNIDGAIFEYNGFEPLLKRFGGGEYPPINCVVSVPVMTDYQLWVSSGTEEEPTEDDVFGWYKEIIINDSTPASVEYKYAGFDYSYNFPAIGGVKYYHVPTPEYATFLWFNQTLKYISSLGGTIISCWVEPSTSFVYKHADAFELSSEQRDALKTTVIDIKPTPTPSVLHQVEYTPKNNKLKTHPYKYLTIINNNNTEKTFKPQLFSTFKANGDYSVNFKNIYNDGVNYMFGVYPTEYNTKQKKLLNTYITPDDYANLILTAQHPPIAWSEDSFTKWETQYGTQFTLSVIGKNIQNFGSLGSSIAVASAPKASIQSKAGVVGGVTKIASDILNDIGTYQSKVNSYDDVNGSIGNTFFNVQKDKYLTAYIKGITADNAQCIDNYFTVFGYAVKKYRVPYVAQLTNRGTAITFNTEPNKKFGLRSRFNYIKCQDTNIDTIEGSYINASDIDKIEKIFNDGITFWNVTKVLPPFNITKDFRTDGYNNYTDDNNINSEVINEQNEEE